MSNASPDLLELEASTAPMPSQITFAQTIARAASARPIATVPNESALLHAACAKAEMRAMHHASKLHADLRVKHAKRQSVITHLVSMSVGAILCALGFIGMAPNDQPSRLAREFHLCLEKAAPADTNAIQACRDTAEALYHP